MFPDSFLYQIKVGNDEPFFLTIEQTNNYVVNLGLSFSDFVNEGFGLFYRHHKGQSIHVASYNENQCIFLLKNEFQRARTILRNYLKQSWGLHRSTSKGKLIKLLELDSFRRCVVLANMRR